MHEIDIFSTLNYQLNEFLNVYPMDVSYPNVAYSPKNGVPYLDVDLIPATTVSAAVGQDACTRHVGVYQILIFLPKEGSLLKAKEVVDELKPYFKMSTGINYNGMDLRITKFQVNQYREDDAWFIQPVSISYRTDLEN